MPTIPEATRITLKNILFPTDFSPASNSALPFALAFARMYGATLLPAHVVPSGADARVTSDAQQKLARISLGAALACRRLSARGDLSHEIPRMIQENNVDLVVLGTHGRRGVSKLVLGSGAQTIYRSAACPVLTVGPKAAAHEWKLRRILCPVDLAGDPEPALHYALSLAEENLAQLLVLQAIPMVPWQHRTSEESRSRAAMQKLIPEQTKDWCTLDLLVGWEHPASAILHAATERGADLIVMGVRKARAAGFSAHLPWPVASEVVSQAACPVLTVRI